MSEQLVIRLGSELSDPVHWLVWSTSEDEIIASGELPDANALSSLAERAGDRPIIALAPGSDILLKLVQLPPKAGRKVLQALPFMLEDEISGDIDKQFFALGERDGEHQQLAIVARDRLLQWLSALREAGLKCHKLLPDILAVPEAEQGWSLLTLGEQLLVRQGQWQGLQGERLWLEPTIAHYAKQQEMPLQLQCYTEGVEFSLPNTELVPSSQGLPMELLAKGAMQASFNLLQGEFKPKKETNKNWREWRLAAVLAGVAMLTAVVDKAASLGALAAEQERLQQQIVATYKSAFPNDSRIVNVRAQMNQHMARLEQGGGSISLLLMLSQLSDAFASTQVKPQTLKYDGERAELRIQALADNFEALERFKQQVEQQGYQVQQGAINNRDNGVVGSLSIRS